MCIRDRYRNIPPSTLTLSAHKCLVSPSLMKNPVCMKFYTPWMEMWHTLLLSLYVGLRWLMPIEEHRHSHQRRLLLTCPFWASCLIPSLRWVRCITISIDAGDGTCALWDQQYYTCAYQLTSSQVNWLSMEKKEATVGIDCPVLYMRWIWVCMTFELLSQFSVTSKISLAMCTPITLPWCVDTFCICLVHTWLYSSYQRRVFSQMCAWATCDRYMYMWWNMRVHGKL